MSLVPAKCPECGGIVKIDDSKEAGICMYCGTPFITQKAINNYVTNVNTNVVQNTNINANTVHYHEDQLNRFFVVENGTLIKYNGKSKKITIPSNVITIRAGAFGEADFEEVTISKNVVEIEENAISADKVVLPEDSMLRKLDNNAISTKAIYLPEKVAKNANVTSETIFCHLILYRDSYESLSEFVEVDKTKVFPYYKGQATTADGFTYAHNGETAIIIDVRLNKSGQRSFYFPSKVDGYDVVDISTGALFTVDNAYYHNSIYFPKGLKTLRGFYYNSVTYLFIPDTVTEFLGKSSFYAHWKTEIELEKRTENTENIFDKKKWAGTPYLNMPDKDGVAWGKLCVKNNADYPAIIYTNYHLDAYNEENGHYSSDTHTKLFTIEPNGKFEGKVPLNYSIVLKKDPRARDLYRFVPKTDRRPAGSYRIEHDTSPKVFPEDFVTIDLRVFNYKKPISYSLDGTEHTLSSSIEKLKLAPGEHELKIGKQIIKLDGQDTQVYITKKLLGYEIHTRISQMFIQCDKRSPQNL